MPVWDAPCAPASSLPVHQVAGSMVVMHDDTLPLLPASHPSRTDGDGGRRCQFRLPTCAPRMPVCCTAGVWPPVSPPLGCGGSGVPADAQPRFSVAGVAWWRPSPARQTLKRCDAPAFRLHLTRLEMMPFVQGNGADGQRRDGRPADVVELIRLRRREPCRESLCAAGNVFYRLPYRPRRSLSVLKVLDTEIHAANIMRSDTGNFS